MGYHASRGENIPRKKAEQEEVAEQVEPENAGPSQLRAHVVAHGLRPLLMSSPKEVFEGSKGKTRKSSDEYDDNEEAEKRAYRNKKNELVVPARCIIACLVKASKLYRVKTKGISFSDMVKGSIFVDPEDVPVLDGDGHTYASSGKLGQKNWDPGYAIERSLVVVQRARIIRCRPRIDDWTLEFDIVWNPRIYGLRLEDITRVVKDAGYIGLLDWRPRFGIFEVKSVKEA